MKRRCTIELMEKKYEKSPTGFEKRNETDGRTVCAETSGVGRTEFYKAASVGMNPKIIFTVSEADYAEEKIIKYEKKLFRVIRTYPIGGRKIEITAEGLEPNDD